MPPQRDGLSGVLVFTYGFSYHHPPLTTHPLSLPPLLPLPSLLKADHLADPYVANGFTAATAGKFTPLA